MTSSTNHLFTLHTAAHADQREAIPILHVKYRAQFLLVAGVGRHVVLSVCYTKLS